ncbi:MAG: cupin domain-containing protein [Dehalococcoidia bacterium]|nr:cupin domain-containing protein [Dehalococcoidia bacterium]
MTTEFVRATDAEWKSQVVTVADVPIVNLMPGANTHIVPGRNMTLSFATVDANTYATVHSHPHEQMMIILKGEMDVIVAGKYYHVKAGDVVPIPGDIEHGAQAQDTPCELVEVFSPARKEFEEKLRQASGTSA